MSNNNIKINFDPSSIINGINQIYEKLKSENKGQNNGLILNTSSELKNAQLIISQINQMIGKGLTTKEEAKQFDSLIKSLDTSMKKTGNHLEKLNLENLTNEAKAAKAVFEEQEKALRKVIAQQKTNIETQLRGVSNASKLTKEITEEAKAGKSLTEIQRNINNGLDEQIQKQQQIIQQRQAALDVAKQEKPTSVNMPSSLRAVSFQQANGGAINTSQFANVKQIYQDSVMGAKSAEDALKRFKQGLENIGLEYKKEQTIFKNLSSSYTDFSDKNDTATKKIKQATTELENADKNLVKLNEQQKVVNNLSNNQKIVDSVKRIAEETKKATTAENDYKKAKDSANNANLPALQQFLNSLRIQTTGLRQSTQATRAQIAAQEDLNQQFDMFRSRVQYVFTFASALRSINNIIKTTFEDVKELDKAFASIAMVTDYSVQEMWSSYGQYAEMANELGQSTKDVISSSALFFQQGVSRTFFIKKVRKY